MWLTIVLAYCAVCWLAAVVMARVWAPDFANRAAAQGMSALRFELATVVIAPIAMPLVVWSIIRHVVPEYRRIGQLRWALKTVREYEFVKVNSLHVAVPVRRQFERHTPALFQLGFDLLGDFRMKSKPVEVHDRILLSSDGKIVATICAVLDSGGESFISVLSDGTCVHTSSVTNPRPQRTVEPRDQLLIQYLPDQPAEDRYRRHLDALHEQAAASGSSVLTLKPDQFRELMVYDQRIFNRWRYRHGDLPAKPPEPDLKTLAS